MGAGDRLAEGGVDEIVECRMGGEGRQGWRWFSTIDRIDSLMFGNGDRETGIAPVVGEVGVGRQ